MNRRTLLIRLSPTLRIGFDESAPTRQLWIDPFLYFEQPATCSPVLFCARAKTNAETQRSRGRRSEDQIRILVLPPQLCFSAFV